ncbi:uncharacterized protein J8A68_002433 [[Candida] subhashii]|uniref:Elongation factor 1 alpha-like protein n=1 Tax=[Candida] subhashii TaxID=561895 RepID=A0A8J5UY21_9ASCO|nr:uncharacterized protein J8A68_002433 [[Candida] subhashii]KAG7664055.1 hypothetical protein J8A68_002433 [[Candida] subhashii]
MDYDEDELNYRSEEGEEEEFHEDNLTNEEYELLHQLLPKLKLQLKDYNDEIDDYNLKESLYYNYFELKPTIEELKSKYKKSIATSTPPMSKLAQLAKARAQKRQQQQQEDQTSPPVSDDSQSNPTPSKPNTKLSSIAKNRANRSNESPSPIPKSIAILDRLSSSSNSPSPTPTPSTRHIRILKKKPIKPTTPSHETSTASQFPEVEMKDVEEEPIIPEIIFDITLDNSILSQKPSNSISLFWFNEGGEQQQIKRRKLQDDDIFKQITNINLEKITQVKENFTKPSPDDEILQAQKQAFEVDLSNLTISNKEQQQSSDRKKSIVKETKPFKKIDLEKELRTNPNYTKPHKSFVVIGHVDAGKSTLMGRLLFDYGIVDAKTVNKLVRESEKAGKGSFALAWIMDQTEEERSHGVTVDICATDFETPSTKFTAIDAPGHKDFVPQMIGGVSQADFALLVVDTITGEFESGFAMDGQTKEHTILAKNLGIEKICVVLNKMDKENWNQTRFDIIKNQLTEFLTGPEVEFNEDQIDFIPISALSGNNVVKRDESIDALNWYTGPTLGSYLENVELANKSENLYTEPFFLSVHDVYKSTGELKVSGKISSGYIMAGETIISLPSEESLQVNTIKEAKKPVDFSISGQLIQMAFKASQLSNEAVEQIRIGDLITKLGSPARTVKKFIVSLHLFNMDKPLLVGMPFILFRNNCQVPARVSKIIEITSGKKKKKLLHLVSKQTAIVEITVDENSSLPLTKYSDNKILGRIVIRREGVTIGAGTVVDF